MILFELTGSENHPVYQDLELSNGNRQYDFLRSIVVVALAVKKVFLSQQIVKALNFQAITCLHTNAGEYRPCAVNVGTYKPPEFHQVQAWMDDFVNEVNIIWRETDPVILATFVLWRLNYIHPFINGNGRTARATCYFVLCASVGFLLPGTIILPELIRREREAYVIALQQVDLSYTKGALNLAPLHHLISQLLDEQLASAALRPEEATDRKILTLAPPVNTNTIDA